MRTRVFLVDDHGVLRQGLRLLIDSHPDLQVIGETGSGRDAAELLARSGGADVVILDISMPDAMGFNVAAELRSSSPQARIVVLTRHSEKAYVRQMLQRGANGYVLKQSGAEVLLSAIRSVREGGTYLDPAVAAKMFEASAPSRGGASDELTAREREVLTMVALGHTNKEIAGILGITVKTVETHKGNGMHKLDILTRAELVRFALAQGWLDRR